MKIIPTILLLAIIWTPNMAQAQFRMGSQDGHSRQNGNRQFQNQLRRELNNHGGRILGEVDRALGGGHYTLPIPPKMTVPTPLPTPLPYPQPLRQPLPHPPIYPPNPIVHPPSPAPFPSPDGGGCRIVPQPQPQPITEPAPAEPRPAGPEATELLPQVESGQIVTLEIGQFGKSEGAVLVKIDNLVLTAEMLTWSANKIEAKMPYLPMADAAEALIAVVNSDGDIVDKILIELLPPSEPESSDIDSVSESDSN